MERPLVLLADDNDATCALVAAILQRDFNLDIATDGSEAIEKLRVREYAAVLLDLRMPHIDGFGVLEFLACDRPELIQRVLVLTASLSRQEIDRVRTFAVAGIIPKPFEVEMLLETVRQCTSSEGVQPHLRGPLLSGGMILLLGEILRNRWLLP
ncbi:MAG TPA: response regulator [Thermoanaerobaculia bacterium]